MRLTAGQEYAIIYVEIYVIRRENDMDKLQAQKRIDELCGIIDYHRKKYYLEDSPEISDDAFDTLMHELKDLEEQYPEFRKPTTPTTRVGGYVADKFDKVNHAVPLKSLNDVFSPEEVRSYLEKCERELGYKPSFAVEYKMLK